MALNTKDLAMGPNFYQTISLTGREAAYTIHGFEVNIHSSQASGTGTGRVPAGSNKVKITTVTNQSWELPKHHGNMVASNKKYVAYVLEGRSGYVIRLIQNESRNRALLKNFVGTILDVSFAHANSNLLACIDQGGNLYIWDLDRAKDMTDIQTCALKTHISRNTENMFHPDNVDHRLVWSPYIPQEEGEEQDTCNIVVTHGNDVEVFDVHVLFKEYPSGLKLVRDKLSKGILTIKDAHEKVVHDVSLSPDGQVLATASEDGHLKFWQIDWTLEEGEKSKCLHDFQPHKGAPVTRLIFCDNHLSQDPSTQFWRFLLTAANSNTEVKVWCTVSWKCLQTFSFLPPVGSDEHEPIPHILLNLDLSASYLLAADAKRMALYILQLFHDGSLGDASVTSITEYLLTQPIYSFVVAGHTPVSPREGSESGDEGEGEDDDLVKFSMKEFDSRRSVVLIKLLCIQSKSMQELLVRFEPPDLMGIPPSLPSDDLLKNLVPKSSPKPLQPPPSAPIVPTATDQVSPLHTLTMSSPTHFASLPTDLKDTPTPGFFQSLPPSSYPSTGSPKLLTPSEFASPAKTESPLSVLNSSSLPLLTTPTIPSAQQPDKREPFTSQAGLTGEAISPSSVLPPPVHQSPGTLTSATLTSVTEVDPAPTDLGEGDKDENTTAQQYSDLSNTTEPPVGLDEKQPQQAEPQLESHDVSHDISRDLATEEKKEKELGNVASDVESNDLNVSDKEEEGESISTKEVQQSMDNIFKLLKMENPQSTSESSPPMNFDEFTKILNLPHSAESGGKPLTSTEKSLALGEGPKSDEFVSLAPRSPREKRAPGASSSGATVDNSEIVNATGAPTPAEHLQLLKERIPPAENDEVPLLSDLGVTDESIAESLAEQKMKEEAEENPWPDIGQPEVEVKVVKDKEDEGKEKVAEDISKELPREQEVNGDSGGGGGVSQPEPSPWATGYEKGVPVISGLVMPSADVAVDVMMTPSGQSHFLAEVSRDQQEESHDQSKRDATPGPADEKGEELVQEVGEGTLTELVSRSKKKTRRGTKGKTKKPGTNADMLEAAAVVEVGYSDSEQESDLMAAVGQLSQRLARQREELDQLRVEQQNLFQSLQQKLDAMTSAIASAQRSSLAEHAREQQQKLDKVLRDKQQVDKQRQERLTQTLSQALTTAVTSKLDKLIKHEMKNTVTPSMKVAMTTLTEQLSAHIQRWLSSTDLAVKETLTRALQTRGLPEQIGSAVATGIASTYQETFRTTVLPAFERSCSEMMKQIDENFRRGTADYLSQLQHQHQHYHNPAMQHLNASIQALHSSLQSWITPGQSSPLYSHIQSCLHQEMASLTEQTKQVVSEVVSSAVQKEVGAAVQEQVAKMSPEARQEEERKKKQEDVQRYLRSQQYNSAFEVALSTSDLQLVVHLCQQLSPDDIFDDNSTNPLSQPVLLSLIQQLSVNLQDHLELKIKYLEQCILALDVNNEVTKSHMATVILQLSQQLAAVEKSFEANPTAAKPTIKKSVRRLKMLSERLCQPLQ